MTRSEVFWGVCCLLGLTACGSADAWAVPKSTAQSRAGAPVADAGQMPAPGSGLPDVTFTLDGHVDAGGEIQSCQYVRMPTDRGEIAVPRAESHYTPGSHHFLVYRTTFTDFPDDGKVHECGVNDLIANVSGTYYEAQSPNAERDLPPGVAHIFKPGEIILLTAHYLNTSTEDLDTHVDFRLHTMPRDEVEQEAGSFFFYNYQLTVPPLSHVSVTRACPIPKDVNLALLWSHMHSRGVGFVATTNDAAAAQRMGDLYDSEGWAEPVPRSFPYAPPVTIHAGSNITYTCTYDNPTTNTFTQGPSAATNEMCILHGMYWPRMDSSTEMCLTGTAVDSADE